MMHLAIKSTKEWPGTSTRFMNISSANGSI